MVKAPRIAIRRAIRAQLQTLARVRGRVFVDRSEAFRHARGTGELPALCLLGLTETPVESLAAPREYRRAFRVGVELIVARAHAMAQDLAGSPTNDTDAASVDRLSEQVEAALLSDPTLGGLIRELVYVRTSFDYTERGEVPLGAALVEFDAVYYTLHRERAAIGAADFLRAHLDWELAGALPTTRSFADDVALRA